MTDKDRRNKANDILQNSFNKGGTLREQCISAMLKFSDSETEALQTKLNNERKMNESHVNTLLKQIEDKNKTNL